MGGALGLFLGVSFVSVLELAELIVDMFLGCKSSLNKQVSANKAHKQPPKQPPRKYILS